MKSMDAKKILKWVVVVFVFLGFIAFMIWLSILSVKPAKQENEFQFDKAVVAADFSECSKIGR